jgi:hypothetical protein
VSGCPFATSSRYWPSGTFQRYSLDEVQVEETPVIGESLPIRPLDVLCIPARDEADEIVALLLSQVLQRSGINTQSLPSGPTSDAWSAVADMDPAIVCISALPPFAIDHARVLYQKLRAKSPKLDVVICLWNFEGNLEKAARRLKLTDVRRLQVSLNGAMEQVIARTRPCLREPNDLSEITMLDTSSEILLSAKKAVAT